MVHRFPKAGLYSTKFRKALTDTDNALNVFKLRLKALDKAAFAFDKAVLAGVKQKGFVGRAGRYVEKPLL